MKNFINKVKKSIEREAAKSAIIVFRFTHGKKDGAVSYLLEISSVAVVIILIITGIITGFDFGPLWTKVTTAFGDAIDKATSAFK